MPKLLKNETMKRNRLNILPSKPEKEKECNLKVSRKKEIIKIKAEIN